MTGAGEVLEALSGRAAGAKLEPLVPSVVSPVHLAVENDLWRVTFEDGAKAVLRIAHPEMEAEFDRAAMIAGAISAAKAGVGPKVLAQDASLGALLLEHLGDGWRMATMWDLHDPGTRRAVRTAMTRLHASAPVPHRFEPLPRLRDVGERAKAAGTPLPDDFEWLRDGAEQVGEAVAARPAASVLCRNDGASSNIMLHPDGGVRLLDFDQAGMNDPAYDLGVLMAEGAVFEDEALAWLEEEEDEKGKRRLLCRAQLLGAVDDLLWATRAALHAQVSQRTHLEFRKYSEWRFMRARRTLADRRFEWMLRMTDGRVT
jgi:thiamine kinase-like enzyme